MNSNITCDLQETVEGCININNQDDVTLDCNGYSIIGPGPGSGVNTVGIFVTGSNVIIKNCNIENFYFGILNDIRLDGSLTVESTTVSNNEIGISVERGFLALKNVLAENNREGLSIFSDKRKVVMIMPTSVTIQRRIS